MQRPLAAVLMAAVVIGSSIALPASSVAALTGDTTTTFTLSGGALSISVPASVSIGSGSAGGAAFSGPLGSVTVTDLRALLTDAWTASVSSSDFTTGAATAAETVTKSRISYWSGTASSTTGTAVFTPGQATSNLAAGLGSSQTAYAATAGTGSTAATWNPTLIVTPPATSVVGAYTGTITHSVA
jgi:hypothetical protein